MVGSAAPLVDVYDFTVSSDESERGGGDGGTSIVMDDSSATTNASLRWRILRRALLRRSSNADNQSDLGIERISRKTNRGYNLIPCHPVDCCPDEKAASSSKTNHFDGSRDACVCYTLPLDNDPKIFLHQRGDSHADLNDFEISTKYDIDNTGLVCRWPSEEVLAYYCLTHVDMFRSKKVIELGSGYGLAGLVIAMVSEALEIVISDGNPQVVDYIQRNIKANSSEFGDTKVKSMMLHWSRDELSYISNTYDIIIASDCTFLKEFHKGLAQTVKLLLKKEGPSEALFFSPKRGDSLDKFLAEVKKIGLSCSVTEIYDILIWSQHQGFINGDGSWPSYEKDHCYPLLVRLTL